jgi:carboxymethylenebutenolidase
MTTMTTTSGHNYIAADTSWVDIGEGTRAFLAKPKRREGPFGAVILGHERYGLVQHTLDLTAKWASYGYVCIAPDMASHWDGDKVALNAGDAHLTLTDDQVTFYYSLSLDHLLRMSEVDSNRIMAMGVCQSGGYPLLLNSVRAEVSANLIFYGGQGTAEDIIAKCNAPILGIWGEDDFIISINHVQDFRNALERQGKSYDFKVYPGSPHGWLNDTMPGRYFQPEAEAAWAHMIAFVDRVQAGGYPADRVRRSYSSDIAVDYDFTKKVRLA